MLDWALHYLEKAYHMKLFYKYTNLNGIWTNLKHVENRWKKLFN
jgi:hypothetical protein